MSARRRWSIAVLACVMVATFLIVSAAVRFLPLIPGIVVAVVTPTMVGVWGGKHLYRVRSIERRHQSDQTPP